jgi:serine/threonine protein kinase
MEHRDRAAVESDEEESTLDNTKQPPGCVSAVAQRAAPRVSPGLRSDDALPLENWLTQELTPGTVINSKYRVDAVLGRGAMGVVVACEHLELRERVALKFLLKRGFGGTDEFATRFQREAQVCAKLKNQHITRVLDVGIWREDAAFMVMEYLDGSDLRHVVRHHGRLPVEQAIGYVVQLCEGLAEAHARGIVHRDLKPSNVFIVRNVDGSDLVKILDFGISKIIDDQSPGATEMTETGLVLGSPKYMSPEQLFEPAAVGPHSDIWAIGVILYEMLMGHSPFEAPSLSQAIAWLSSDKMPPSLCAELPDVTPELEMVIFRCFARATAQRTGNVAVLAGDLLGAVGSPNADPVFATLESILASNASRDGSRGGLAALGDDSATRSGSGDMRRGLSSQARRVARRRRAAKAIGAVGVFGLLAGLGGVWWLRHPILPTGPSPRSAAPAPSVHVVVRAMPPEATIEVDGQDRGAGLLSFDATGDGHDHTIRVSAHGYAPELRIVQFSSDLQVDISLEKLVPAPPVSAPPVSAPSTAPAAVSQPAWRASPAPRIVPKSTTPPAASSTGESNCSPPYYFSNGIKTFKPECL